MKNIICAIILLVFAKNFAQEVTRQPLSAEELQTAIIQYKEMWSSKEYLDHKQNAYNFSVMINHQSQAYNPKDIKATEKWFEDNWRSTKFQSLEELMDNYHKLKAEIANIMIEWKELFSLMARASLEQLALIMKPEEETFDRLVKQ